MKKITVFIVLFILLVVGVIAQIPDGMQGHLFSNVFGDGGSEGVGGEYDFKGGDIKNVENTETKYIKITEDGANDYKTKVLVSKNDDGEAIWLDRGVNDITLTASSYNGNIGGYGQAHNECGDDYFMCNELQVIDYIRRGGSITGSTVFRVIGGGSKVIGGFVNGNIVIGSPNDCNGFTSSSNEVFGSYWNTAVNRGVTGSCDLSYPIACCSYMGG
jgi:hypothetical protein